MARPLRLSPTTKDNIRKQLKKGDLLKDLAKQYNVSKSTIHRLKYPATTNADVLAREAKALENIDKLQHVKVKKKPKPAGISSGSKTSAEMDNEQIRRNGWLSQIDELGRKCIMLEQEVILLKMKIAELVMKEG